MNYDSPVEDLFEGLNEKQMEAVTTTEGPLLILAGAGSGKTRVLTCRVAYLLRTGKCRPGQIMALTFTNKAAEEMKDRICRILQADLRLWVSTFHASSARILRGAISHLGYESSFVIFDTQDQLNIIKECLKELDLDFKQYIPRKILGIISKAKNDLVDEDQYEQQSSDYFSRKVSEIYQLYQKKLKSSNCLDFDDLLFLTVRLFRERPEILRAYQEQYKFILVDEYQDTNMVQYLLVKMLSQKHRNLCVVGDDDQSIYQFRGADIRNILEFERDYPEAQVIKLEENYRSKGNILEAAFHVIKNNQERKPKRLWTQQPPGDKIFYFCGRDEYQEAQYIADEIKKNLDSFKEFAVLYRTNAQSRVLEEVFLRKDISFTIYGGVRFYERLEIKDTLAYLRLVDNPSDNFSLKRIINVPRKGIGKKTVEKLEVMASDQNLTLFESLSRWDESGVTQNTGRKIEEFTNLIHNLRRMREFLSVRELTEEIIEKTGYLTALEAEGTLESRSRIENLKEMVSAAREFDVSSEDKSLTAFLTGISLITSSEEGLQEEEREVKVRLMTFHSAKGLEFPVVFLAGMEEGIFPHSMSLDSEHGLEEERRLCYVGCTRAMERLYLTHAKQRNLYGRLVFNPPSCFFKEIPAELLGDNFLDEEEQAEKEIDFISNPDEDWKVGDGLYHSKWGKGVVRTVGSSGSDLVLTVLFPTEGTKTILATFAPIKKVTN
ncbi:DNA helicase PcrA [Candidatus Contubernalis alkaliaceticus]|uniref:DNA helicase PcrA n=1 Tax=Candidatus Contubernalis alkaliaceticus TaxID=338645 RepID=UPI001F4C4E6B|nr:DNA helicase PcrA [Candidatus Contubernalis alkalaceticus]UNC91518.1 DNA helicase PcrA [Candidatus Contubernalis alkalaceticus]